MLLVGGGGITMFYKKLSKFTKFIVFFMVLLCFFCSYDLLNLLHIYTGISSYFLTGVCSAIFIIFAINSQLFKTILLFKPILFLGKISYSLYLIHCIVLFSFIHCFYDILPKLYNSFNGICCKYFVKLFIL